MLNLTFKKKVNEVSLCKIIIKSEVVPVANSLMKCFYCNQSIQNDDSSLDLYISCKSCGKSIHSHHGMQSAYVLENFKNLHWECTECRRCCICRERRDKTSPADNYFTCSYCERIYHVECLGFYTLDKTQGSAASDNSEEKNRISGDTQQCLLNGAKEEDMKMCVICKNEKIFGNYSNLLNGLRNLNLKIDFKAHNNEVRQIIKSSSANQMRRTLFERHVVRNNKDLLPASKRYLKSEFDSDFHDIFHNCLNVPENEVELFKEAYEDSLMLSNTSKMVISETDSLMYPARIFFNDLLIKTQCSSPYPTLVSTAPILYVCDKCFDFFTSLTLFRNHKNKEKLTNTDLTPPGIPVYKEKVYESGKGLENLVVYEVDGQMSQKYCHDLCLFARSFLDHKTVYNNVEMFLFYVLTLQKTTEQGISTSKFVGYFSKEKLQSFESFNLSCIVVVPPYLKQGFGFFLIDFSYLISLKEMRFGSPEKPFSPLGLIAYSSYWKTKILSFLCKELDRNDCPTSIIDISLKTAIHPDDVLTTLEDLEMIVHDGDSGELAIKIDENYIEKINNEAFGSKKFAHEKNYIIKNCILHKELATFDRYKT